VERRQLGRGRAAVRFVDEADFGFGWTLDDKLARTSHALVSGGEVWIVDAVEGDGVDDRIRSLGTVRGVVQLLDRHGRDCAAFAIRYDVPLYVVPDQETLGPFEIARVLRVPGWLEVALWWPERRVLAVADALGTSRFFRAGGEPIGVHPLLRLFRPPKRLGRYDPEHVLVGHGDGVHENAGAALHEALRTARRRLPRALADVFRSG
jgi:hypothetical protein